MRSNPRSVMRSRQAIEDADDELDALTRPGSELARPLQRRLRDLMWERCGVVRTEADLLHALEVARPAARCRLRYRRSPNCGRMDRSGPRARPSSRSLRRRGDAAVCDRTPRDARRPNTRGLPRARSCVGGELLHRRRDEAVGRAGPIGPARALRIAGPTAAGHGRAAPRMSSGAGGAARRPRRASLDQRFSG